ncbi:xanthine dehydrogenase family protein molybdopterin-binding subunit [Phaeodactylibacter luteus]|uniref:Xanthine dehydrogenase family protein molybdopterin-binding subunit n=1 Tax=Phaeodactylibacter luteus TaxID=1564516 RepID=A0A5C6RGA2_9BACT|nr:molybdopterin cofactor-binding domain-containing protein [Phaeodactylibacter luteus]TXB59746.1 xanthine dehydrogenase family protein molybdopterin-binding subunit [Phaeodactylibacter luteus]
MAQDKPRKKVSRRKFLVRAGLGTVGVMAIGTYVFRNPIRREVLEMAETLVPPYSGSGTSANLWFEVLEDNRVRLHSPKVEMGQGAFTGLAQIAADELDVAPGQIEVVAAATDSGVVDAMSTGGSLSIASLWQPLREMAATMREMLKNEAAKQLGADAGSLSTREGIVFSGEGSLTYAEIAAAATEWELPEVPELRAAAQYQYVGKPVQRVDLAPKVFGSPIFGLDAELPGMLHASIIRPEAVGAQLKSLDSKAAADMPGVVKIVELENAVGVVAESYPQALAACRKVKVEWDVPKRWAEEDIRSLLQVGKGDKMVTQKAGKAVSEEDGAVVSLSFTSPIGAHAQLEPNGALAHVEEGKATVVLSTQVVGITRNQVAEALGMKPEQVNVVPTYLGGGFGRRLNTAHAIEAALLSRAVGKPVKYMFTRQEEFQHDTFRPPTHHIVKARLGEDGLLDALEHHYASGDVAIGSLIMPSALHQVLGTDIGAMRGGNIMYDNIPNRRAVQWHTSLPFATSWWRSLGLLANTFAIESMVDEMAMRSGQHPADFRLAHISEEGAGARIKAVIREAVEKAGYSDEVQNGRAMGLAASIDTNSPCAHVVEVSVEAGEIKVHKVTCVLDCGLAVNPDQVRAQCEGSILMGMSAAMHEKMTLHKGELQPTIYGPYQMALMRHAPKEINVYLLQGAEVPLPVGEPPLGPIAAAIGNAVRRLTGQRLTDLPLRMG